MTGRNKMGNKKRALVFCDHFFTNVLFEEVVQGNPFWEKIERVYVNVEWPKKPLCIGMAVDECCPYPEEILAEANTYHLLITQMGKVDHVLLEQASSLEVIACLRSGPVNIDLVQATERGIPVFFVPWRSVETVAEFTVGLFIALRRSIVWAHREMEEGLWTQSRYFLYEVASPPLEETTVGIVGFGQVGRRVSTLFQTLSCQVVACDPFVPEETIRSLGVTKLEFEELLGSSDVVSLHVRLRNNIILLGERELRLMKPTAFLINTARGRLIDERALFRVLQERRIAGAALDTFSIEPVGEANPFRELTNVILTPHIAGASQSTARKGAQAVAWMVRDFYEGKVSLSECANPQVLGKNVHCSSIVSIMMHHDA